jgi:hypothetical protein
MSVFTPGASVTIGNPAVVINGVDPQLSAVVGTASRGPVNVATPVTGSSFQTTFGAPVARKYDAGTIIAEAADNGVNTVFVTRVTDGTDTAASNTVANAFTLSSVSTGSGYNGVVVNYGAGAKSNTITVTVSLAGETTEVYSNLPASNAAVFKVAHDAAINAGAGVLRGPSALIVANSAIMTTLPTLPSSVVLTGGTDGANVSSANLIGSDGTTKTGMYTLRGLGIQFAVLADLDTSSTFTTQAAFGEAEFILMVAVLPSGTSVANAVTTKASVGLDSDRTVLLHGDWLTLDDGLNGLRKVSPQGFYLGKRASLLPHQSVLNKPMDGIVASERSLSAGPYTVADTDSLFKAGIEVIKNPIPRGSAWGAAGGYTTTSNPATNSDAWATMTNYLAQTLQAAGGQYVGEDNNSDTRDAVVGSISHFLSGLVTKGILALVGGKAPYSVTCDDTNNTQDDITLGYLNVLVEVSYQGIIRFFNVSLIGGAGVTITVSA